MQLKLNQNYLTIRCRSWTEVTLVLYLSSAEATTKAKFELDTAGPKATVVRYKSRDTKAESKITLALDIKGVAGGKC